MRKKIVELFAAFLLLIGTALPSQAAEEPRHTEIRPMYTGVVLVAVDISISEQGYATVYSDFFVLPEYKIEGTLQLRQDSGYTVGTWDISGTLNPAFSRSMYVSSGHKYYTFVSVDVYDSNNVKVDHIEVSSKQCPYN